MFFKKSKAKAKIKRLEQRETDLIAEHGKFVIEISELKSQLKKIRESALKIEKERDELKKMVRAQTEADLLINVLKAVGVIKTSKSKTLDYFQQNQRIRAMQQQANAMNTSLGLAGFGAGFGLMGGL